MTVGRICSREVDLARPDESAQAAAQRMAARQVGSLLVVDDAHRPVGIVTDRDLALGVVGKALDPVVTSVESIMTHGPTVVPEDTETSVAIEHMQTHGVRRLPVVAADGKLVGILSIDDVFVQLANEMQHAATLLVRSSPTSA